MDKIELFKIALETRRFEIQMLWQRSNYFLILNTAIAVGFFSLQNDFFRLIAGTLGIVVSWLWYRVNLGGKYWQTRWEEAAWRLENECAPDANLFAASKTEVQEQVSNGLSRWEHTGFAKWLDCRILEKPSVSQQMTVLSMIFVLFWAISIALSLFAPR